MIECVPPPSLHLKLRSVNYILDECAERSVTQNGQNLVKEFAIDKGIVKKNYHSGEFEVRIFIVYVSAFCSDKLSGQSVQ